MNPQLGFGQMPGTYQTYGTQNSNKKKMLIIFGALVVIVLGTLAYLILANKSDPAKDAMVDLVISQNEALRVSDTYSKNIGDSKLRAYDAELQAIESSGNGQIMTVLSKSYGVKTISTEAQKQAIDKKTDELLTSAIKLNKFDDDYAEKMVELLGAQLKLLQTAQSNIKSAQNRTTLAGVAANISDLRDRFGAVTSNPSD